MNRFATFTHVNMKRRVQAQRKFAQGATIPAPPNERRLDTQDSVETVKNTKINVFMNQMTASRLMDEVSFGIIHTHDPRVLLERLKENKVNNMIKSTEDDDSPAPKPEIITRGKKSKPQKTLRKKSPREINKSNPEIKKINTRKRSLLGKSSSGPIKEKSACDSRRMRSHFSGYSTDDDIPLNKINNKWNTEKPKNRKKSPENVELPPAAEMLPNTSMPSSSFYGRNEIERWVEVGAIESKSALQDLTFKVPEIPHKNSGKSKKSNSDNALTSSRDFDTSPRRESSPGSLKRSQSCDVYTFSEIDNVIGTPPTPFIRQSKSKETEHSPPDNGSAGVDNASTSVKSDNKTTNLGDDTASPENFAVSAEIETATTDTSQSLEKDNLIQEKKLLDAPTFIPTEKEFLNPIAYIQKIMPAAAKYGMCKIVPPASFKPDCFLDDSAKFTATNQYPAKMFSRWGPATKEFCAIKSYLSTQKVHFTRPPLIDSVEVNLPKLYHVVQKMGGLNTVIEKNKWTKVAEEMNYPKGSGSEKKLDQVYVKYILPYDTLKNRERNDLKEKVEKQWNRRYNKMLERARNPLRKQKQNLGECSSDDDDDYDDQDNGALDESEDCVVVGRKMNLATFKKIANHTKQMLFPNAKPSIDEVEDKYWRLVVSADEHVSVNSAAVDTGEYGYGFTKDKADSYSKHPWNLKVLGNNSESVLRSLTPVLSVNVPSLHLGMMFSTSCWHRDPHGLPWIEYLHEGPSKIWYGIPDKQSGKFRSAVETLCPAFAQNKTIWLASDITMIPPNLLVDNDVSLAKTIQNPGEFIVILPKAYSSSICTGYTISESVYFAPFSWLATVQNIFQELRESCEPTMFSLEQLLIALAKDGRVSSSILPTVHRALETIIGDEITSRMMLESYQLNTTLDKHRKNQTATWNVSQLEECDICRITLYLSKVINLTNKNSAHCLQHALRVLESQSIKNKINTKADLILYFSNDALNSVLNRLVKRLFPSDSSTD